MINNTYFLFSFLLITLVIIVNGWTDAPNAITSAVVTKTLSLKKAIIISVIFNFLGILLMTLISSKVVDTVSNMAYFPKDNRLSIIALCGGMFSVVVWSILAWLFGLPTSESHALLAGITGSAISLNNGFRGININEWLKVIYGLLISCFGAMIMSYLLISKINKNKYYLKHKNYQISLTSLLSFLHGAQDGQKFIGVFVILISLSKQIEISTIPSWIIIYCSVMMGIGTSMGGRRIIHTIGEKITKINIIDGLITDFVAVICIFITTLFGLPISTTHARSMSVVGVGLKKGINQINFKILGSLIFTWIMTFPCCGLIGYLIKP